MLPFQEGTEVLSSLRRHGVTAPVILITALGALKDKILGLDSCPDCRSPHRCPGPRLSGAGYHGPVSAPGCAGRLPAGRPREDALYYGKQNIYDVILLDRMLPFQEGTEGEQAERGRKVLAMKKMCLRKTVSFLLVLSMIAAFTGCGGDPTSSGSGTDADSGMDGASWPETSPVLPPAR